MFLYRMIKYSEAYCLENKVLRYMLSLQFKSTGHMIWNNVIYNAMNEKLDKTVYASFKTRHIVEKVLFSVCHSEMPKHFKTSAKLLKLFRKHLSLFYYFTCNLNLSLSLSLFSLSLFLSISISTFLKGK